ncbi:hypothetical protein SB777_35445, partial [Burkholderia sp. SIMBA_052]
MLADALALAQEDTPDLLISMATLTGAARVAVGADIAPFFTDREGDADTGEQRAGRRGPGLAAAVSRPLRGDDRTRHCRSGQRTIRGIGR